MDHNDPKAVRTIREKTVRIDRSVCIGASTCVAIAPKAWALDKEAKAVITDTAGEEDDEALLEAAKGCPVQAITITDSDGKQIFP